MVPKNTPDHPDLVGGPKNDPVYPPEHGPEMTVPELLLELLR
jgi:hypothetical protein